LGGSGKRIHALHLGAGTVSSSISSVYVFLPFLYYLRIPAVSPRCSLHNFSPSAAAGSAPDVIGISGRRVAVADGGRRLAGGILLWTTGDTPPCPTPTRHPAVTLPPYSARGAAPPPATYLRDMPFRSGRLSGSSLIMYHRFRFQFDAVVTGRQDAVVVLGGAAGAPLCLLCS